MDRDKLKRILSQNFYMTNTGAGYMALGKYGVSQSWVAEQMEKQGGLCDSCKQDLEGKKWAVDHSHERDKVRGLVCFSCNTALRSAEKVKRFVEYLKKHGDWYD